MESLARRARRPNRSHFLAAYQCVMLWYASFLLRSVRTALAWRHRSSRQPLRKRSQQAHLQTSRSVAASLLACPLLRLLRGVPQLHSKWDASYRPLSHQAAVGSVPLSDEDLALLVRHIPALTRTPSAGAAGSTVASPELPTLRLPPTEYAAVVAAAAEASKGTSV